MSHAHHQIRDQVRAQLRSQAHTSWPALSSWQVQITQGSVRVGDAERDAAARALGEHFAQGRLDRDEYDQRVDVALAARTRGELARVFRDLPSAALPFTSPPAPRARMARRTARRRVPVLPLLMILLGVWLFVGQWWVLFAGFGALLLARRVGR